MSPSNQEREQRGKTIIHITIQEYLDDKAADWMEHVSDEQYTGELDSGK